MTIGLTGRIFGLMLGAGAMVMSVAGVAQDAAGSRDTQTARPGAELEITVDGDAVSVRLEDAPLREVMKRLASQSGFEVRISDDLAPRSLSDQFTELPLDEALRRLLHESNYALIYRDPARQDKLTEVYILPPGVAAPRIEPGPPALADVDPRALIDDLDPKTLPPGMREALLTGAQAGGELQGGVAARHAEVISRLIDILESQGASDPQTIRRLRERLDNLPKP